MLISPVFFFFLNVAIKHLRIMYVAHCIPIEQACFQAFFQFLEPSKPPPTSIFTLEVFSAWNALTLLFKWLVFLILQLQCHLFKEVLPDHPPMSFLALFPSSPPLPLESKPHNSGTICPVHCCSPST